MSSLPERVLDRVVAVVDTCTIFCVDSRANPVSCFLSGVEQIRTGIPSALPALHSKSPTASATRYVDIFGVVSNLTVCLPAAGPGVSETTAPFEIA